jgi:transposase
MKMTSDKLYERRQQMAEQVKAGRSLGEVARMFRVSIQTVRNACAEQSVTIRRELSKGAA